MPHHGRSRATRSAHGRALRLRVAVAALLTFALVGGGAGFAAAQQAVSSATLGGRVEDADGASVGGAFVVATNLGTNQHLSATTDDEGRFRFSYVPVGDYRLLVECGGFSPSATRLTLSVGEAADVRVKLSAGGLAESVEVMASAQLIEAARTQVSETVTPREVDALPLNGRNYLDLALLVPGVSRTNTGSVQRFAETSAVAGTGISFSGQRNLNNSFLVDGFSANDDAANLAGAAYSQEVVREFQVVTSGGIAEFGRASAGVVNVLTKSGTNELRGRLYGFLRNQRFDARNPLAPRKDPLTQGQYGANLGGPLKRDRTFFFSNFEQTRRNDAAVVTIRPEDVALINRRLDEVAYGGPRIETGVVPSGSDVTNFFARLDHRRSEATSLSARYSLYELAALNSRTVGGLNATSRGTGLTSRDQTFAASAVKTFGARALNEARLQLTRSRLSAPVNDARGPAVNISGVASFGTATFSPTARALDLFEFVDNFSYQRGAHSLKAGADFLLNRARINFPGAVQGVYTFTSRAAFLSGSYASFQQAFGEPSQFQSNPNLGLFVQDEWRPRADLTINAGLRYDVQRLPAPIATDANNFSPRFGLAFAPGDRRTVVRAGFGLYFDRVPLRAASNALQRDGSKYVVVQLGPGEASAPTFPNVLRSLPPGLKTRPNVTRIDPEIESSYSLQTSLQVERELPGGATLAVGYTGLRGRHLILSRNLNAPTLTASEATRLGVVNLGRPDPLWGNVSRYESSGVSDFDGLLVSFNQRTGSWATVRASYTFSKATDNTGNFFFSTPQNNSDLRGERGPSDNDQRHRLSLSGTLEAPRASVGASATRRALEGFRLSYIFTYGSRLPFNVLTGTDRNGDTNFNDRPAGVGRNTGRGFDSASLDLRLSRRFALTERTAFEFIVEGFNVLNRANLQLPNNVHGPGDAPLPAFGRATAAADPRQIQFGLRLDF
ncbi:MAG TPA: carboxypeptidase regulatory-like domain-containing protein [Pyrinomonadaceae bacterium]|nr:carboxypeptidase regulatory-like domain-containing protein [Pyrinomonadaceae bacterium]